MKCPCCDRSMKVPAYAWHYTDSYGVECRVLTECCDKIVIVTPIRSYIASAYFGSGDEDDFGNSPKQMEQSNE